VDDDLLERYASLAVHVGVNLQPGQDVYINADIEHAEVARAVAEQAYRAGARRVVVQYQDAVVRRSTLIHAPLETLRTVPGWQHEELAEIERTGAAVISLTGSPDPTLFEGIAAERVSAVPLEYAQATRRLLLGGAVAWNIIAAPNPGWATQIFGEPDLERLWDALRVAMRLDGGDPVAAWQQQRETLARRAQALNALRADMIRFRGEGTDLSVGLLAQGLWSSGSFRTHAGVEFMPNLPTEEVFTSPDRRRADGVARLTRPLVMPRAGVLVEGLELRFEGGRIVEARADRGGDAVVVELDTDEGARSLGELALVDSSSRIRDAGVVFHNTLYDENAGSHLAWGQSLPTAIENGTDRDDDELFELGLNSSAVHTDVVIGGPGVHVDALTASGEVIPVIRDDAWVLETAAA
jgi:aminopeptidase